MHIMSDYTDMMSLYEQDKSYFDDDSIIDECMSLDDDDDIFNISEAVEFGSDKLSRPSEYGLNAGIKAADQFTHAGDGRDIDLVFHDSYDDTDNTDFSDFNNEIPHEEIGVDINTVPAVHGEDDQFETEDDEAAEHAKISDAELASDDDDGLVESCIDYIDYDDLF